MDKKGLVIKLFVWGLSIVSLGLTTQVSHSAQRVGEELRCLALLKGKNPETGERLSRNQLAEALDPGYDTTFKLLFKDLENVGDHTGPERCMAFLNSIFYPGIDESGFRIKELQMIDGEQTRLGEKAGKGSRRLDLACECTCWNGVEKPKTGKHMEKFDVEMQRTYDPRFMDRMENYGEDLRDKRSKIPVKVLALYNYESNGERSIISKRVLKNLETGEDEAVREGAPEIYLINLAEQVAKMESGIAIKIEGRELKEEGELWLALLGMRQWQENRGKVKPTYPIGFVSAKDLGGPQFQSALVLLNAKNRDENILKDLIDSMLREEGEHAGALEIAKEQVTAINNVKGAMKRFMAMGEFMRGELAETKRCIVNYNQIKKEKPSLADLWNEALEERLNIMEDLIANPDPDEEPVTEGKVEEERNKLSIGGELYNFFMGKIQPQLQTEQ
ncbi:MAG: Rpn family recombination-promoting nuclease/putative transposase [Puniceicoccales bacterium]|jgi:hypothetical protein|nr:Rpn family recombination-promoting nuclease/putative transposase [Puniceicoccales bacterium]